jgi:hypothetical protein
VPHISLVFCEMWDTTVLNWECFRMQRLELSFVVSHISRKTSEMWGTRPYPSRKACLNGKLSQ